MRCHGCASGCAALVSSAIAGRGSVTVAEGCDMAQRLAAVLDTSRSINREERFREKTTILPSLRRRAGRAPGRGRVRGRPGAGGRTVHQGDRPRPRAGDRPRRRRLHHRARRPACRRRARGARRPAVAGGPGRRRRGRRGAVLPVPPRLSPRVREGPARGQRDRADPAVGPPAHRRRLHGRAGRGARDARPVLRGGRSRSRVLRRSGGDRGSLGRGSAVADPRGGRDGRAGAEPAHHRPLPVRHGIACSSGGRSSTH